MTNPDDTERARELPCFEQGDLPINVTFAVAYLDGALEDEPLEIWKQWRTVRDYVQLAALRQPAESPAVEREATLEQVKAATARVIERARGVPGCTAEMLAQAAVFEGLSLLPKSRESERELVDALEQIRGGTGANARDMRQIAARALAKHRSLQAGKGEVA